MTDENTVARDIAQLDVDFAAHINLNSFCGFISDEKSYLDACNLTALFERNRPTAKLYNKKEKIPKIIHQIWIGGDLPAKYLAYQASWQKFHPDWQYRLWNDDMVDKFDFPTKDLFQSTSNMGLKVDILRVEILKAFGGLYVDMDRVCLKSFDIMHHMYDYYTGMSCSPIIYMLHRGLRNLRHNIQPIKLFDLTNSIIAARVDHPLLSHYLVAVRLLWHEQTMIPMSLIEKIYKKFFLKNYEEVVKTLVLTYRTHHEVFMKHGQDGGINIVFPPSFFEPLDNGLRVKWIVPQNWYWSLRALSKGKMTYFNGIKANTYSVHYYDGTWMHTSDPASLPSP